MDGCDIQLMTIRTTAWKERGGKSTALSSSGLLPHCWICAGRRRTTGIRVRTDPKIGRLCSAMRHTTLAPQPEQHIIARLSTGDRETILLAERCLETVSKDSGDRSPGYHGTITINKPAVILGDMIAAAREAQPGWLPDEGGSPALLSRARTLMARSEWRRWRLVMP